MNWKSLDIVQHSTFGIGRVREYLGDKILVDFIKVGEKMLLKSAPLVLTALPLGVEFPRHSRKAASRGSKETVSPRRPAPEFNYLVKRFLDVFEGGFEASLFDSAERKYKIDAADLLDANLGKSEFEALLQESGHSEIWARAKKVLQETNLVFPREKIQFIAIFDRPENQPQFASQLHKLLHGSGEPGKRFEDFSQMLSVHSICKWTIATYYQFLATRGDSMFMKPIVTQRIADSLNFALNYRSQPNWLTYSRLQDLSGRLSAELNDRGLKPRSGIDIQGFIWASIQIEEGKY